jgi:hypothetical protein
MPLAVDIRPIELEETGFRFRTGYTVWNAKGRFILQTESMARVLRRRAAYFRVNQTGRVYELESRHKSVELPIAAIRWITRSGD